MRGMPMILRAQFGANVEGDHCWRIYSSITRGGRRKGEGDGIRGWAIEGRLVSGIGERHCVCIRAAMLSIKEVDEPGSPVGQSRLA